MTHIYHLFLFLFLSQTFVVGSEDDPTCKRCDRFIADHRSEKDAPASIFAPFLECISSSNHSEAIESIRVVAKEYTTRDDSYHAPIAVKKTWAKDVWRKKLRDGRNKLPGLAVGAGPRDARIMGLHAGTGFGKTHAL